MVTICTLNCALAEFLDLGHGCSQLATQCARNPSWFGLLLSQAQQGQRSWWLVSAKNQATPTPTLASFSALGRGKREHSPVQHLLMARGTVPVGAAQPPPGLGEDTNPSRESSSLEVMMHGKQSRAPTRSEEQDPESRNGEGSQANWFIDQTSCSRQLVTGQESPPGL